MGGVEIMSYRSASTKILIEVEERHEAELAAITGVIGVGFELSENEVLAVRARQTGPGAVGAPSALTLALSQWGEGTGRNRPRGWLVAVRAPGVGTYFMRTSPRGCGASGGAIAPGLSPPAGRSGPGRSCPTRGRAPRGAGGIRRVASAASL